MTDVPQTQERAECPYCGCGFIPSEPGQVFCSVFCEQQYALEREPKSDQA